MSTISYIIQIPNWHLKKLKDESYTSNLSKQNTHALLLEKNKHHWMKSGVNQSLNPGCRKEHFELQ